jgi:hypothetical protein
MKAGFMAFLTAGLLFLLPSAPLGAAPAQETMSLPAPAQSGGMSLLEALSLRHSNRNFSSAPLSEQQISDLLWAVWGINRPDGRHTAPTANNRQEVAVYVVLASGVWRYEPNGHVLLKESGQNLLSRFSAAPLVLAYAAPQDNFGPMHVGSLYQNAGLFCASSGLANVVRATGANSLDDVLKLPGGYKVYIVQPVGLPE